jgi:tRNA threonylcarbamoyl adenosine modification protein YjeE
MVPITYAGDLGAGKTTLSRGIVRGKFEDDDMIVTSPSYLLDNTYNYGPQEHIHHMDLYRLPVGYPDLGILGIPSIFSTAVCIIEWPDRIPSDLLPKSYLDVQISIPAGNMRRFDSLIPCVGPERQNLSTAGHDGPDENNSGDEGGCDAVGALQEQAESAAQAERVISMNCVGRRWLDKADTLLEVLSRQPAS